MAIVEVEFELLKPTIIFSRLVCKCRSILLSIIFFSYWRGIADFEFLEGLIEEYIHAATSKQQLILLHKVLNLPYVIDSLQHKNDLTRIYTNVLCT